MEIKQSEEELPLKAFISGYTSKNLTKAQILKKLKKEFPEIQNINFPKIGALWQGYAFVDFQIKEDFFKFIKLKRIRIKEFEMNLVIKPVKLGKALKKHLKDLKKRKLRIQNIPVNWDDIILENFFSKIGDIENCYVISPKREGIVIFKGRKDAKQSYELGKISVEGNLTLEVSYDDNKGDQCDKTERNGNRITSLPIKEVRNYKENEKIPLETEKRDSRICHFKEFPHILDYHQNGPLKTVYFSLREFDYRRHDDTLLETNVRMNVSGKYP